MRWVGQRTDQHREGEGDEGARQGAKLELQLKLVSPRHCAIQLDICDSFCSFEKITFARISVAQDTHAHAVPAFTSC